MQERIRVISAEVLSKAWSTLTRTTFDYRRSDGSWEKQIRESYDRGNGAAVIPYNPVRGTILLVRQFRYPAFVTGHVDPLLEACAGLLDADDPVTCIRKEASEELGYRLNDLTMVFMPYMSPGSVTERIACFTATYSPDDKISEGGGHAAEGEDIEVVEMPLADAIAAVKDGRVIDGKTILLIQHWQMATSVK